MKEMIIFKVMFVAMILGATGYVSANEAAQSQEQIQAECAAEAKGALYPQEYLEECIEEKKQALKEQSGEAKEAS